MKIFFVITIAILQFVYAKDNFYYQNNQKIMISSQHSISRDNSKIDYYKNNRGIVLGVSDKLIVKLYDDKNLEKILTLFHLIVKNKLAKNLYLLKASSKDVTIEISNILNEKEYVKYAHPDFIKKSVSR